MKLYNLLIERTDFTSAVDYGNLANAINSQIKNLEILSWIQAIIFHYYYLEKKKNPPKEIYGGKINRGGKGIIYSMDKMPPDLLRILENFFIWLNEQSSSNSTNFHTSTK